MELFADRRPIVAVIVGNKIVKTEGTKWLAEMNKKAKTTLTFFATDGVHFKSEKIKGIYYDFEQERWREKYFPLPDILYVRGGSGEKVSRVLEKFDKLGIPRINPITGFNKAELYRKLHHDKAVADHLPYTKTIEDLSEVKKYLRKMRKVYVKACRGRRGTKVMRIVKRSGGKYEYSYSIIGRLVRKKVTRYRSVEKAMDKLFGDRKVIVQQAIDLIRVGSDRPVDLRAELQRNKHGHIEIVAVPIRVGQSGSPITTHAKAYRFDEYLDRLFPKYSKEQLEALKKRIDQFLVTVYRSVEKCYGEFGEIGIDFAVDRKGRIWLIECNAQSAKVSVRKAYDTNTVQKIYLNPLEYAQRIAKQKVTAHIADQAEGAD